MATIIRTRCVKGEYKTAYKYYTSVKVLLTVIQQGFLDDNGGTTEFDLLFEYGDWYSDFDPKAFEATVNDVRDRLPDSVRDYSRRKEENKKSIAEWRVYAAREIHNASNGRFN